MTTIFDRLSSQPRVAAVAFAAFLAVLSPSLAIAQAPDASVGGQKAQFITIDGARTRFYEAGSGADVVLLIHGARPGGTSSANTWTPIVAGLAARYRVLAPDRQGHGMSENVSGIYTATGEMEHIYAFLKAKNVTRLHVIGQSTGAWHAARLALEKPEMVRSLIIVDSATLSPPIGNLAERRAKIGLGQGAGAQRDGTIEDGFRHNMEALSYNKQHVTEEFVAAAGFMARQPSGMKTDAAMKGEEAKRYEANIQAGARGDARMDRGRPAADADAALLGQERSVGDRRGRPEAVRHDRGEEQAHADADRQRPRPLPLPRTPGGVRPHGDGVHGAVLIGEK